MSVDAVSTFLAVGALILLACLVAIVVARVLGIAFPKVRTVYESVSLSIEGQGVALAWAMALIATAGSLYYSEIAGFPPCEYCWYQRIAMYPLAVILGIGYFSRDSKVRRYVLALAVPGAAIAAYHYAIQRFPDLQIGSCSNLVPCNSAWVWKFDLVSIPFMAFVAFSVIITVLLIDRPPAHPVVTTVDQPTEEPE